MDENPNEKKDHVDEHQVLNKGIPMALNQQPKPE
jgi:hypothetical protein